MQKMRSETTLLNPFAHTMQTYTNHILTWQCWSSSSSLHCLAKTHKIIIFFFSFSSMGTKTCPYDISMYYVSKLNLYAWPRPICMFIPLPSGESNVDFRPWLETMNPNRINITSLLYNEYECTHRYFWQDRLHSLWWFYNYMVYNTFNIIDLILHINTHIIVLLAIFHILSNIRFKNTMMEL